MIISRQALHDMLAGILQRERPIAQYPSLGVGPAMNLDASLESSSPSYRYSTTQRSGGTVAGLVLVAAGCWCAGVLLFYLRQNPIGRSETLGPIELRAIVAFSYFVTAAALISLGYYTIQHRRRWQVILRDDELLYRGAFESWTLLRRDLSWRTRRYVWDIFKIGPQTIQIRRFAGGRPTIEFPSRLADPRFRDWLGHMNRAEAAREADSAPLPTAPTHTRFGPGVIALHARPVTYILIALNVLAFLPMTHGGVDEWQIALMKFGANFAPLVHSGESWRLLSSMFLHSNFEHLLGNMLALFFFGRYVEAIYGSTRFLLIYLVTGTIAGLVTGLIQPLSMGVGASGAIFGVIGAELAFLFAGHRAGHVLHSLSAKLTRVTYRVLWGSAAATLISLTKPNATRIDFVAHLAGLVAGIILGWVLLRPLAGRARREDRWLRPVVVILASVTLLSLPLWSAALAGPDARAKAMVQAAQVESGIETYIGILHFEGQGRPKNPTEAFKWFLRAAEKGNPAAEFYLGRQYALGLGVAQDMSQAASWYQKAADQGMAEAQYNLGLAYLKGEGVKVDNRMAFDLFCKAADQGLPNAKNTLGFMLENGRDVGRDRQQAAACIAKAAEQGNAVAKENPGGVYPPGRGGPQNDAEAAHWRGVAAAIGGSSAQDEMGRLYEFGRSVPVDEVAAAQLFQKLANQGNRDAQYQLALLYLKGAGLPQDRDQAMHWLQAAADQGFPAAQNKLGELYRDQAVSDRGKSLGLAVKWFRKAAVQDSAEAQYSLGLLYLEGRGVPKSSDTAGIWFQRAAWQGSAPAQAQLDRLRDRRAAEKDRALNARFNKQEAIEAERQRQQTRDQIQVHAIKILRGCLHDNLHDNPPLAMEVICIHSSLLSASSPDAVSAIRPIEERAQELLQQERLNTISEVDAQRQLSAALADGNAAAPH